MNYVDAALPPLTTQFLVSRNTVICSHGKEINQQLDVTESSVRLVNDALDWIIENPGRACDLVDIYTDPAVAHAAEFHTVGIDSDFDAITSADLMAVTMLGVSTPVGVVRQLLEGGPRAADAERLLRSLGPDRDLWDVECMGELQSALCLWILVHGYNGAGDVYAGKLLARKRPRLIPIWDSRVERLLTSPDGTKPSNWWAALRGSLQEPERRRSLEEIRDRCLPAGLLLRFIDIVAWKQGSRI